ncbi:hypothetical protein D3C80_2178900 [compost metagenome]
MITPDAMSQVISLLVHLQHNMGTAAHLCLLHQSKKLKGITVTLLIVDEQRLPYN